MKTAQQYIDKLSKEMPYLNSCDLKIAKFAYIEGKCEYRNKIKELIKRLESVSCVSGGEYSKEAHLAATYTKKHMLEIVVGMLLEDNNVN